MASAEAWQEAAPNSILENLYGPTELTIACLLHRWDAGALTRALRQRNGADRPALSGPGGAGTG